MMGLYAAVLAELSNRWKEMAENTAGSICANIRENILVYSYI